MANKAKEQDDKLEEKTETTEEQSPEEVLKSKKKESKAAKKAGPKAERAKDEAKTEDKAEKAESKEEPAKPQVQAKPRSERRGKKYHDAFKQVDRTKEYSLEEAIDLAQKTSYAKFDASVEMHINLGVDPKQADQAVRGTVALPHGSGKSQRVAALVPDDKVKAAKDAGADVAGEKALLEQLGKGNFDFDILVASPDMMSQLGKHAKALGPKGLMPNPKSGTVTNDIAKTVKELKGGRVEFRIDGFGIIHQGIGKVSFKPEELVENAQTLLKAITQAKPDNLKNEYIQKITVTATMGPGIKALLPKS